VSPAICSGLFRTAAEYQRVVRSLVVDAARRRSMGQAARAAVLSRFDLRVIASRYADVYRTLVAEQHGTGGGQQP
jgi:glycosyltransferase involved in cell wall biosynthesis